MLREYHRIVADDKPRTGLAFVKEWMENHCKLVCQDEDKMATALGDFSKDIAEKVASNNGSGQVLLVVKKSSVGQEKSVRLKVLISMILIFHAHGLRSVISS